ncbi:MAG: hypothetical protein HQL48_00315, partial [Gammaproteobacteria bacterium]|nr:hypothetical protein [Gammaproteobacteria bacterium]
TNVTGEALRRIGFGGFLHLEIGSRLRKELLQDETLISGLVRCLTIQGAG